MEPSEAIATMDALAQPTRLEIMNRLLRSGGVAITAGELAQQIGVTPPTASGHLAILNRAGLVDLKKNGRHVLCKASPDRIDALRDFLTHLTT